MKNINEQGRSMVEMLGVLAIIGVLSAGGLAGYSKAMFKHKLNNSIDQITMIVTNIRTLYGTQGNYNGLSNTMAVQAGVVPAAMYTNADVEDGEDTPLINPFKGEVKITTSTVGAEGEAAEGVDATAFEISYTGLPSEACVQIATSDFGTGAGSGFIGSAAAAGEEESATAPHVATKVGDPTEGDPMSLSAAIEDCAGTGTTNAVTLKFY